MNYIQQIARDIRSRVTNDLMPEQDTDELFLIYAMLVLTKGAQTTREDVHNAWSAWMSKSDPTHESIKPFNELDATAQCEDEPFQAAIVAVAEARPRQAS